LSFEEGCASLSYSYYFDALNLDEVFIDKDKEPTFFERIVPVFAASSASYPMELIYTAGDGHTSRKRNTFWV
ncbi:unnamed protein product, partial [Allacma fusca]